MPHIAQSADTVQTPAIACQAQHCAARQPVVRTKERSPQETAEPTVLICSNEAGPGAPPTTGNRSHGGSQHCNPACSLRLQNRAATRQVALSVCKATTKQHCCLAVWTPDCRQMTVCQAAFLVGITQLSSEDVTCRTMSDSSLVRRRSEHCYPWQSRSAYRYSLV